MCCDEGISRKCGGSRCVGMKVLVGRCFGMKIPTRKCGG